MSSNDDPPFHPGLVKKLILGRGDQPPKRITNEAVHATSELLRLFVHEAKHRAGIEAECEKEGAADQTGDGIEASDKNGGDDRVLIRADHITKVAAELLMDFA